MIKKSEKVWFVKVRASYLPRTWQGWALYTLFVLFLGVTAVVAFRGGRSYAGIVYFLLPQYTSALVIMHWIAGRYSKS